MSSVTMLSGRLSDMLPCHGRPWHTEKRFSTHYIFCRSAPLCCGFFVHFFQCLDIFIKKNMQGNGNLHSAKNAKNDEFYTQYADIEKEIGQYDPEHFKGQAVYCPCDDYRFSNFVRYFKDNFGRLWLRLLIATNYDIGDGAWKYEYDGENETITKLEGNGDFASEECTRIKEECDMVITNPPFSLFRKFVKWLYD